MKSQRLSYSVAVGYINLIVALILSVVGLALLLMDQYLMGAILGLVGLYLVYTSTLYYVQLVGATLLVANIYRRPRRYAARDFVGFEKSFNPEAPIRICFADGTSYRFKPVLLSNSWLDVEVMDQFIAYWGKEINDQAVYSAVMATSTQ